MRKPLFSRKKYHQITHQTAQKKCPTKLIFPESPRAIFIISIISIWFARGCFVVQRSIQRYERSAIQKPLIPIVTPEEKKVNTIAINTLFVIKKYQKRLLDIRLSTSGQAW
jgi:hypothetical protein